jgi:PIN domain nuclease of toxin-antitoxin system
MKILLDTHVLIWNAAEELPRRFAEYLYNEENELCYSLVSIWEVVIKTSRSKEGFNIDADKLRRGLLFNGFTEISIRPEHILGVGSLPPLHKDPFDRLLLAQSLCEDMPLLTTDSALAKYNANVILL